MKHHATITITQQDIGRLSAVISHYAEIDEPAAAALQDELDRAEVVAQTRVSPHIVTMNSRVVCSDGSGTSREVEVVYPWHADASARRISVLAPLGRALLGAAVGDSIEVRAGGRARTWFIESIEYQPEAAGRLDL